VRFLGVSSLFISNFIDLVLFERFNLTCHDFGRIQTEVSQKIGIWTFELFMISGKLILGKFQNALVIDLRNAELSNFNVFSFVFSFLVSNVINAF
jgi:hypothetical protein